MTTCHIVNFLFTLTQIIQNLQYDSIIIHRDVYFVRSIARCIHISSIPNKERYGTKGFKEFQIKDN